LSLGFVTFLLDALTQSRLQEFSLIGNLSRPVLYKGQELDPAFTSYMQRTLNLSHPSM